MKFSLHIILLLILPSYFIGQTFCDCDSIYKNKSFSGFCTEYLNLRWQTVPKAEAQFKHYVHYERGKIAKNYGWIVFNKKDKIYQNEKQILKVDSIITLNGVYTWKDKNNIAIEELYYKDGYIQKHINRDFIGKKKGNQTFEIMEWDYSKHPFKQHYMRFNKHKQIKNNIYYLPVNFNGWCRVEADDTCSDNILEVKTISDNAYDKIFGKWNPKSSKLKITTNIHDKDSCFSIYVTNNKDTLYSNGFTTEDYISLDTLYSGTYKINIYNNKRQNELYFTKYISLPPDTIIYLHINLDSNEELVYNDQVLNQEIEDKEEVQFTLGYLDSRWIEKNPVIINNFSLGVTAYYYAPFAKHFGFLIGVGAGFSQHYFSKDTSFMKSNLSKAKYERYSNLKLNIEAKFRVCSGNHRKSRHSRPMLTLDVGAGYYFPILFRHVANYDAGQKTVNRFIHQFTDVRAFVNFGFYPVTVFAEYRLSDFLIGNYPELPLYNVGLRFLF